MVYWNIFAILVSKKNYKLKNCTVNYFLIVAEWLISTFCEFAFDFSSFEQNLVWQICRKLKDKNNCCILYEAACCFSIERIFMDNRLNFYFFKMKTNLMRTKSSRIESTEFRVYRFFQFFHVLVRSKRTRVKRIFY